mmetsp:Transcript_30580/g.67791  ORF Transcript_30580/g.67791 Transcript_30580/m.67791 type:complete len:241 (-) Transcript_30580:536-1258(-)
MSSSSTMSSSSVPPPPPPLRLPDGWVAFRDPQSGRLYYANTETNETSWTAPPPPPLPPPPPPLPPPPPPSAASSVVPESAVAVRSIFGEAPAGTAGGNEPILSCTSETPSVSESKCHPEISASSSAASQSVSVARADPPQLSPAKSTCPSTLLQTFAKGSNLGDWHQMMGAVHGYRDTVGMPKSLLSQTSSEPPPPQILSCAAPCTRYNHVLGSMMRSSTTTYFCFLVITNHATSSSHTS